MAYEFDATCQHGNDPYTCSACHDEKTAANAYEPPCADNRHDLPASRAMWVTYFCQRCGYDERWDH